MRALPSNAFPASAFPARALLAALAVAALAVAATVSPAQAQPVRRAAPAEALVIAGAYEMSNEAGTRKCVLLLRPSEAPGGYALGFPAQCRMALPVLQKVQGWSVRTMAAAPRARITLTAADASPLLDFAEEGPSGAAQARDGAGQIYHLRPTQGSSLATRVDSLVGARPAPPVAYSPPAPDPGAMVKAIGSYRLARPGDDKGCTLTLERGSDGAIEARAVLAKGCADPGVTFFGPRGWSIAADTLWLIGVRGRLSFERNRRGGWEKSPGQGKPLILEKL